MAITKSGAWFKDKNPFNKVPQPIRSSLYRAEAMGLGPISLAFGINDVASGNTSVGGALANATTGAASYYGIEKAMAKPAAGITKALSPLVSKAPKVGALKFLSKLPGWAGTAAKVGTAIIGSGIIGSKVKHVADQYAPVWRRESVRLPGNLTPQQLEYIRTTVREVADKYQ